MLDRKLMAVIEKTFGDNYFKKYTEKFETRLMVQKVLYILTHSQASKKIKFPYRWTFYLHGPYSSEIAHMIYYIAELEKSERGEFEELTSEETKIIEIFKEFRNKLIHICKPENLTGKHFEMLATLIYIANQVGDKFKDLERSFKTHKEDLFQDIGKKKFKTFYDALKSFQYIKAK